MRSRSRSVRPLVACTVLAVLLTTSAAATAAGVAPGDASAEQKSQAMAHFTAGKHALETKNWEKATLELRASLEVVDSPNARLELYQIARQINHDVALLSVHGVKLNTKPRSVMIGLGATVSSHTPHISMKTLSQRNVQRSTANLDRRQRKRSQHCSVEKRPGVRYPRV